MRTVSHITRSAAAGFLLCAVSPGYAASSSQPMDAGMQSPVAWAPIEDIPFGVVADWLENFDSYVTGSQIHGQGGWKGWFNDPAAGALVSDAQASSVPNSVAVAGPTDLIHEFSGYTSGVHVLSAKQFIPAAFTGESYFIVQNRYNDAGLDLSWSTQVIFDSALGTAANSTGAANPGSTPYVTDAWAELTLVIDLDADRQSFYYNGTLVYAGSWTAQFAPNTGSGPGTLTIGALDLFANGASVIHYDDVSLRADEIFVDGFDPPPL